MALVVVTLQHVTRYSPRLNEKSFYVLRVVTFIRYFSLGAVALSINACNLMTVQLSTYYKMADYIPDQSRKLLFI